MIIVRWTAIFACCLLVFSNAACGDELLDSRRTVHPTPANIPDSPSLIVPVGTYSDSEELAKWANAISSAVVEFEIGRASGDPDYVIGLVEDITRLPSGDILILDSRFNVLRLFSRNGDALWVGSRPGQGPGELSFPEALGIRRSPVAFTVGVLDRARKIVTFVPDGDSLVFETNISTEVSAEDLCVADNKWVVQGSRAAGGVVHELGEDGSMRSMGDLYSDDNPLVQNQLSDGPVGCMSHGMPLLFSRKNFPFVWALNPLTGDVMWVAQVVDFEQMSIVDYMMPNGRPAVAFGGDEGVWDIIKGIVQVGSTPFALLQIARYRRDEFPTLRSFSEIQSYLIDTRTGTGVGLGSALPEVFWIDSESFLGAVTAPYPKLIAFRIKGG